MPSTHIPSDVPVPAVRRCRGMQERFSLGRIPSIAPTKDELVVREVLHDLDEGQRLSAVAGVTDAGVAWLELRHSSGDRRSRVLDAMRRWLRARTPQREHELPDANERLVLSTPAAQLELVLLGNPETTLLSLGPSGDLLPGSRPYRLSPFETRYLADTGTPHPTRKGWESPGGLATDLHTHFAGCVRAGPLMRIARDYDIVWPERVLAAAGVVAGSDMATSSLPAQALDRIAASMSAPDDRQITFLDMERIYTVRGPVTKHRAALPALLTQAAEDYRAMGVTYAELSLGQVVEAGVLRAVHDALPAIEARTGVRLRFLAAMSRHDDLEWDLDYLDRLEAVLDSPYIVGVDFMGHETNSTLAFARQIGEAAARAARARPRFVVRVHAGENPAHPENVRLAAEAVRGHDVQLRIGHGLYGTDEVSLRLLKALDAIVEFNLNSNLALNNILSASDVPLARYVRAGVRAVLGTDGYGIYQTTMEMEARAARLAGLGDDGLAWIRDSEQHYVSMRLRADSANTAAPSGWVIPADSPPHHYGQDVEAKKRTALAERNAGWSKRLAGAGVEALPESALDQLVRGRLCLLFAGAWANAWRGMDPSQQRAVRNAIETALDGRSNDDTLVVTGGTQFGVEGIAARAARQRGMDVLGVLVRDLDPSCVGEGYLTHAVLLANTLYEKAAALYGRMRGWDGGVLFFAGGPIVHDEVQVASNLRLRHLLMAGAGGASARHAAQQPNLAFRTGAEALQAIRGWETQPRPAEPFWHKGPNPTADAVVVRRTREPGVREVLLIRRDEDSPAEPGKWALPGGFVAGSSPRGCRWEPGPETALQACVRELREETGLHLGSAAARMAVAGVYERGGRDPRDTPEAWSQSTAFAVELGIGEASGPVAGGDDAEQARWFRLDALPSPLAFDHEAILRDALKALG